MTEVEILGPAPARGGGYKVDVSKGSQVGRVSSEWFSRPDDERFLSLDELMASVKGRAARSATRTVDSAAVWVEASREDPERLALVLPGVLDWRSGVYNPLVDVSRDTTTLYASDRDVFLFLVDDLHPIEAWRLPNREPDLYFRGFYCWNSEVGAKTLGIASFYLRAVCQNRNLWGVEDFEEITIRHSKYAANRFAHEAAPALTRFADSSAQPFVNGIRQARKRIVARSDEDRTEFLRKRGFGKAETAKIIETVLAEEGHPPASVFDFVQGITAVTRTRPHQDARLELEGRAKKLLDRAA
jgi:hypothetical protein